MSDAVEMHFFCVRRTRLIVSDAVKMHFFVSDAREMGSTNRDTSLEQKIRGRSSERRLVHAL